MDGTAARRQRVAKGGLLRRIIDSLHGPKAGSSESAELSPFTSSQLIAMLGDARKRTLDMVSDLNQGRLEVPYHPAINPPLWELGHLAWFQDRWLLQHLRGLPPVRPDGDAIWDHTAVAHADRWRRPHPSRSETMAYMHRVLEQVADFLAREPDEIFKSVGYFHWLVIMHEDMRGEALASTRQMLGYPAPHLSPSDKPMLTVTRDYESDAKVRGGEFMLGAAAGSLHVFDNEKWSHEVEIAPFAIARAPVTNRQYAQFIAEGGYEREELWSLEGWKWREEERIWHPIYWYPDKDEAWAVRLFDKIRVAEPDLPVVNINWYEAEAWCRWAGRRLPTEAEWELAASCFEAKRIYPWGDELPMTGDANLDAGTLGCVPVGAFSAGDSAYGCRQMLGNVWEWTASDFQPYPGFAPNPDRDYSEPWFGSNFKVLRGGSWATRSRLISNTFRNFALKRRNDLFAGFRTCAL